MGGIKGGLKNDRFCKHHAIVAIRLTKHGRAGIGSNLHSHCSTLYFGICTVFSQNIQLMKHTYNASCGQTSGQTIATTNNHMLDNPDSRVWQAPTPHASVMMGWLQGTPIVSGDSRYRRGSPARTLAPHSPPVEPHPARNSLSVLGSVL